MGNITPPISGIVTFWDSALGHTLRDAIITFGTSIVLILLDSLSGVKLSGQWSEFAFLVPVIVTAIKAYLHIKDPNLPNLPTSMLPKSAHSPK
jgi:hypothetical protein